MTVTDALNPAIKQVHRFFQGSDGAERARSDGTILTDSEGLIGQEYETLWQDGANVLRKQWTAYQQATWVGPVLEPPGETPDRNIYFSDTFHDYDLYGNREKETVTRVEGIEDVDSRRDQNAWGTDPAITQWKAEGPNRGEEVLAQLPELGRTNHLF